MVATGLVLVEEWQLMALDCLYIITLTLLAQTRKGVAAHV